VFRASHIYRLILAACCLLGAVGLDEQNRLFGKQAPMLFLGAALVYLALALLAITGTTGGDPEAAGAGASANAGGFAGAHCHDPRLRRSEQQPEQPADHRGRRQQHPAAAQFSAAGRRAGIFPAGAVLAGQSVANRPSADARNACAGSLDRLLGQLRATDDLVRLGMLGAVLFIAAALTYALAERARRSEALARRRTFELLEWPN
jgi:two-component system sensor histidine kinase PilS (NtrC family)